MRKTCPICREEKLVEDFNKDKKRKDGLQFMCRQCCSEYYRRNATKHKAVTKERRRARRRELKQKIDEIKMLFGCAKCGERDIVCLDFHHVNPTEKEVDIARAISSYEWPWEKVLEEMRKCACLCASCHRKAHAGRFEITPEMLCAV